MLEYIFDPSPSLAEANQLVIDFHYSKRKAGAPRYVGGLRDENGDLVAACFFSQPPTRWSEPVVELSRLVRVDGPKVPLTMLIGRCVKEIRRLGIADLAVSFADNTQEHHGGVYQASSWNYAGFRPPSHDGFNLSDGRFIPRRTANDMLGTSSRTKAPALWAEQGIIATPHFDAGKHLYWRAINKDGARKAERLGLGCLPYPKPIL